MRQWIWTRGSAYMGRAGSTVWTITVILTAEDCKRVNRVRRILYFILRNPLTPCLCRLCVGEISLETVWDTAIENMWIYPSRKDKKAEIILKSEIDDNVLKEIIENLGYTVLEVIIDIPIGFNNPIEIGIIKLL